MKQSFKNEMRGLMTRAWQMVREHGYSLSKALHTCWLNLKLRKAMKTSIVKFYYVKKSDATIREAFGTTDPHRYNYESRGGRNGNFEHCVQYFDKVKNSFRMFKDYNLIHVCL